MKKNVLITNIDDNIGYALSSKISHRSANIFALYPEGEDPEKYSHLKGKVTLIPLSVSNTLILKKHLLLNEYDTIIHIPDFHSNPHKSRKALRRANVFATQQIIEFCLSNKAKLIYCSSVAIYGDSPFELPSHDRSEKIIFGYRAKMIAEIESLIELNRLKGLRAVIFRPAFLYGENCCGFFQTLVKMIRYRILPKVNERIYIHLCSIKLLINLLEQAITNDKSLGKNYNIADEEPVILRELVNFISNNIHKKDYKTFFQLNLYVGRNIARLLHKFHLNSAGKFLERLTHNWFYDIEDLERDFVIHKHNTFIDISDTLN